MAGIADGLVIPAAANLKPGDLIRIVDGGWELVEVPDMHPFAIQVETYLRNTAGITPETLRYAATHESLCRSWIFDLLMELANTLEEDPL